MKGLLSTIIAALLSRFGHLYAEDYFNILQEIYSNRAWSLDDLYQALILMRGHDEPGAVTIIISRLDECDESFLWFLTKISLLNRRHRDRFAWIISSQGSAEIKSRLSEWSSIDLDEHAAGPMHYSDSLPTGQGISTPSIVFRDDAVLPPVNMCAVRPLSHDEASILSSLEDGAASHEATLCEHHASMAQRCLQYLGDCGVQEQMGAFCNSNTSFNRAPLYTDCGNLISYAATYWPVHYRLSGAKRPFQQAVHFFLNGPARNSWSEVQYVLSNPGTRLGRSYLSPLPLMAMHGLDDLVLEWIRREKDSNCFQRDGSLALSEAVSAGHISTARLLLEVVDPDKAALADSITAAVSFGRGGMLHELVQRASMIDGFTWPPRVLHRVAFLDLPDTARILLDCGIEVGPDDHFLGSSPLHLAARYGHVETIKVLLTAQPDLGHKKLGGNTPLHLAAYKANPQTVRLLLDDGADIEATDDDGLTPLLSALTWGNRANFELLLDAGADLNHGKDDLDSAWWQRKPLLYCAHFGFSEETKLLLEHKVNLNCSFQNLSALYLAVESGYVEVSRLLLETGHFDPNEKPEGSDLLLLCAVSNDDPLKSLELTKLLLDYGARIEEEDNSSTWRNTALSRAAGTKNTDVVKLLIERGADVNHSGSGSSSPLYAACYSVQAENVRQLINAKADVNERRDPNAWGPIHASYDSAEIVQILLENRADPDALAGRMSCLTMAVEWEKPATVKVLLNHRPRINLEQTVEAPASSSDWDDDFTALSLACWNRNANMVRQLLEAGANRNHQTKLGKRPLDICIQKGSTAVAKVLLEHRVPVDYTDDDGNTVLNRMPSSAPLSLIKQLVKSGVDPRTPNNRGVTPLRRAVERANAAVAKYLLSKDPNPEYFLDGAPSLVHLTCVNHDLETLKLLVDSGADVKSIDSLPDIDGLIITVVGSWRTPNQELLEYLIKTCGVDIDGRGGYFGNPVATACAYNHVTQLQYLLKHGANPNLEDSNGRRALHLASAYPGPELLNSLFSPEVQSKVQTIVRDQPPKDRMGRTPVHFAASSGDWDVFARVSSLYDQNQLIEPDADGWTPLFWALLTRKANARIVQHLIGHGADIWARVSTGKKEWSPLKLARYIGADQDVLALLAPRVPVTGKKRWVKEFHYSPQAQYRNRECLSCRLVRLFFLGRTIFLSYSLNFVQVIYGINYACHDCVDYNLCFRCYSSRERFHSSHEDDDWIQTGPEFEDDQTEDDKGSAGGDGGLQAGPRSAVGSEGGGEKVYSADQEAEEAQDEDDGSDDIDDNDDDDEELDEEDDDLEESEDDGGEVT
ncbi:ankyrin repeat-containing domain protein [Aspergillus fruticulosus]